MRILHLDLLWFAAFLLVLCLNGHHGMELHISPRLDMAVEVGDTFQLNCTLSGNFTSSDVESVTWTRGLEGQTIPPGSIQVYPKEGVVSLTIENVTVSYDGTYFCEMGNLMPRMKRVRIGRRPAKPLNVTCVSPNFITMVCHVFLDPAETNIPTRWTILYKKDFESEYRLANCSSTSNKFEQVCDEFQSFTRPRNYAIRVIGYSHYTNLSVSMNEVTVRADESLVKPGPLEDVTVHKRGDSRSVTVEWVTPTDFYMEIPLVYRVRLQSIWDNRTLEVVPGRIPDVDLEDFTGKHRLACNLTGLVPHTKYSIYLSCKTEAARGEIYWSRPVQANFMTPEDVPETSTVLTTGSYIQEGCHNESYRRVVLYWQNPSGPLANGKTTGYEIRVFSGKLAPVPSSELQAHGAGRNSHQASMQYMVPAEQRPGNEPLFYEEVTGKRLFYDVGCKMRKDEGYLLEVKAATMKGFSEVVSQLSVPAGDTADEQDVRLVLVEKSGTRYHVTWELEEASCDVTSVTYFWCVPPADGTEQHNVSFVECQSGLDWDTVPVSGCLNGSSRWIDMMADQSEKRFAVSVAVDTVSTGMKWEFLRFKNFNSTPTSPLFRAASVPDNSTQLSIAVLHTRKYNELEGGRPEEYEVVCDVSDVSDQEQSTCPTDQGTTKSYPADFDDSSLHVNGLVPSTEYVVCMRARNQQGSGPFSKPQLVKTTARTLQQPLSVAILAGAVAVSASALLLIVLAVVCCCKVKRRVQVSVHKYRDNIDLPEIYIKKEEVGFWEDSGKGASLPSPETSKEEGINCQQDDGEWSPVSKKGLSRGESCLQYDSDDSLSGNFGFVTPSERKRKLSPALSGYIRVEGCETSNESLDDSSYLQSNGTSRKPENASAVKYPENFKREARVASVPEISLIPQTELGKHKEFDADMSDSNEGHRSVEGVKNMAYQGSQEMLVDSSINHHTGDSLERQNKVTHTSKGPDTSVQAPTELAMVEVQTGLTGQAVGREITLPEDYSQITRVPCSEVSTSSVWERGASDTMIDMENEGAVTTIDNSSNVNKPSVHVSGYVDHSSPLVVGSAPGHGDNSVSVCSTTATEDNVDSYQRVTVPSAGLHPGCTEGESVEIEEGAGTGSAWTLPNSTDASEQDGGSGSVLDSDSISQDFPSESDDYSTDFEFNIEILSNSTDEFDPYKNASDLQDTGSIDSDSTVHSSSDGISIHSESVTMQTESQPRETSPPVVTRSGMESDIQTGSQLQTKQTVSPTVPGSVLESCSKTGSQSRQTVSPIVPGSDLESCSKTGSHSRQTGSPVSADVTEESGSDTGSQSSLSTNSGIVSSYVALNGGSGMSQSFKETNSSKSDEEDHDIVTRNNAKSFQSKSKTFQTDFAMTDNSEVSKRKVTSGHPEIDTSLTTYF